MHARQNAVHPPIANAMDLKLLSTTDPPLVHHWSTTGPPLVHHWLEKLLETTGIQWLPVGCWSVKSSNDDDFDYSRSVNLYLAGNSLEGDLVLSAQALTTIREWIQNSHLDGEDLSNPYIQSLAKEFKALQHTLVKILEPHRAPAADNTVRQPVAHATASAQVRPPVFTPPAPHVPAAPSAQQAGPAPMDAESTSAQLPLKRCKGKQPAVPQPQPKKPVVPYQRGGPLPPIPRSMKPKPHFYAQVASSAPCPRAPAPANTLVILAQALPGLPAERIVQLQQQAQGRELERKHKAPAFTSQGPLRKQVLVSFGTAQHGVNWDVSIVYRTVNTALVAATAATRVLSVGPTYDGYAFETTTVATTKEIDVIRSVVHTTQSHLVYFNIWDSQQGSAAKSLINKTLLFGKKAYFIHAAAAMLELLFQSVFIQVDAVT
ncbi:hypothetical protein BDN70DRAFT_983496 [Pholiota conissans]|uniref:Uncharacterized protein n=1 Tax=Pholiota conissans TaxID=109636 RepID=A0A9P5YKP8_9AGAR|nr:hypothetical protein BDN70DRAFT_983496 [Pholiota conissans]